MNAELDSMQKVAACFATSPVGHGPAVGLVYT